MRRSDQRVPLHRVCSRRTGSISGRHLAMVAKVAKPLCLMLLTLASKIIFRVRSKTFPCGSLHDLSHQRTIGDEFFELCNINSIPALHPALECEFVNVCNFQRPHCTLSPAANRGASPSWHEVAFGRESERRSRSVLQQSAP